MSKESAHLKAEPMNEAPWKTNEWTTHRLRLELLRAQKITQYFPPLAECSLILKPGMLIPTPSGVGSESIIYVLLLLGRPPVRLLAASCGLRFFSWAVSLCVSWRRSGGVSSSHRFRRPRRPLLGTSPVPPKAIHRPEFLDSDTLVTSESRNRGLQAHTVYKGFHTILKFLNC